MDLSDHLMPCRCVPRYKCVACRHYERTGQRLEEGTEASEVVEQLPPEPPTPRSKRRRPYREAAARQRQRMQRLLASLGVKEDAP